MEQEFPKEVAGVCVVGQKFPKQVAEVHMAKPVCYLGSGS